MTDSASSARSGMMETQIRARGVSDPRVLEAMLAIPRHDFVPLELRAHAYEDHPLQIGESQTISQPYIVAFMTELLALNPGDKVLEIGTGSGYQTAVLGRLTPNVFTMEIVEALHETAKPLLVELGIPADHIRLGDGHQGWPEQAPFDAIIVTAAPDHLPPALLDQLKPGGRMVIPVGPTSGTQSLQVIEKKTTGETTCREVLPVRFVPLTRA